MSGPWGEGEAGGKEISLERGAHPLCKCGYLTVHKGSGPFFYGGAGRERAIPQEALPDKKSASVNSSASVFLCVPP